MAGLFTRVEIGHSRHQVGREGDQQVARVGLDRRQPAIVGLRRRDHRHAVVDGGDQLVGVVVMTQKRADDLAGLGMRQLSQMAASANGSPVFMPMA